jgi:surfactin synthase thioesterase subunit/glycosyltransferase involved in cell wall biosynthesis
VKILLGHNSTYYPSQGGGDKSNRLLMEALAARGHTVRVVTRSEHFGEDGHAAFVAALRQRGVAQADGRFMLNGVDVHTLTRDPNLRSYFAIQISEFDPDVIVLSTDDPAQLLLEVALAAPRARTVYLVRATIAVPFGPDSSGRSTARTARLRGADSVVGVSEYVAKYVREYGGIDAVHIPISLMKEQAGGRLGHFDNRYVLMINPCAVKGISIFLGLADAMPDVEFAAVASWGTTGNDMAELQARKNITLLPRTDDIDELFKLTRVLLVPSIWAEARGRVVVEAMAKGVPVIASDIGGIPEAKMGVEPLVPVRAVSAYRPALDSKMVPVAEVPEQEIGPWHEALSMLTADRESWEENARRSFEAARDYLNGLNAGAFEKLLLETPRKERVAAPKKLSADKQKLLALRLKQKTWFPSCSSRLICFPYAGAGTLWCRGWNACAALLPGREARVGEPPLASMAQMVAALEEAIAPMLHQPYVFFGHSMGAGVAFELTRALHKAGRRLPAALIVSSAKAPSLREPLPEPTDAELIAQLERLGGAPAGAAQDSEWMRVVFPALRADTRLYRGYLPVETGPLPVPIFGYCGDSDPNLSPAEMEPWERESSIGFHMRVFKGGHFYFQEDVTALLSSISEDSGGVIR